MISAEEIKALLLKDKDGYAKILASRGEYQQAIRTLQTLLNQAAEAINLAILTHYYDRSLCEDIIQLRKALAAIHPYLSKEGG